MFFWMRTQFGGDRFQRRARNSSRERLLSLLAFLVLCFLPSALRGCAFTVALVKAIWLRHRLGHSQTLGSEAATSSHEVEDQNDQRYNQ